MWFLLDLLDFPAGASIRPMAPVGRSVLASLFAAAGGSGLACGAAVVGRRRPAVWVAGVVLAALSLGSCAVRQRVEDRIVRAHALTFEP